jgi:thiol-disulfide isomerase/thioredoxin
MAVQVATDADFKTLLENNPKVVAKFFANWCGTCRLIAPKYKKMAENEAFHGTLFLDINAEENPDARSMVGVTNLPFFATFKDGKLVQADFTAKPESVEGMIQAIQ